jgi:hypothetical protein
MLSALLVLAVAVAGVGPITCEGWQSSPVARKACCLKMHDDCPDQAASDACCAKSAQRQHTTAEQASGSITIVAMHVAHGAPPAAVLNSVATARGVAAAAHSRSARGRPHDPPFLTSVLLI